MARKCIEVKSLYGYDLNLIARKTENNYTDNVIKAVIMRYNGVHPQIIADTLGVCYATAISYINNWNKLGVASIADHRGGNRPSSLTDEMVEDIRYIVTNKSPGDFGYECSKWSCELLARYIEETYGKKFSDEWVRLLLKNLGFTYKRGLFKPSRADSELQESFKKNGYCVGYN